MINSVPFTSLAGTAFLSIGMSTNANVQIEKLGDIKYDFDLVPTDATVRGIAGIPGSMTAVMWDSMDSGLSLYKAIETEIGAYDGLTAVTAPVAPVTLYWLPRGETNIGNAWRFPFDLRFMDASIDERSQKTTLKFAPRTLNINMSTWAGGVATNNFPTTSYNFRDTATNRTAYLAGDLIYDAISELDTGTGNTTIIAPRVSFPTSLIAAYVNTYPTTTNLTATNMNTFPPTIVVGPDQAYASNQLVYDKVKVLAGLDAAIFGSAFGVNYYMPRNNNTFNVELTNVEFEDLSFVSSPRAINAVALAFTNSNAINSTVNIGNGYPFVYAANGALDGWRSADQQINIAYSSYFPHFNYGFWANNNPTAINGVQFFNPPSLFMFPELAQIIQVFDTATGYALSTGAWTANASLYKIEATILGADKVRPYEVIKFDNTVPLRYQGKHFRPTSLSYDLKADKVKVTAYQIDPEAYTPPPTTLPPSTTTTTGGPTTTTTSTTTVSLPPFFNIGVGVDASTACLDYPSGLTLYGNATTFAASTLFYLNEARTTLYVGSNFFYSDGSWVHRINNVGASIFDEPCDGVTTTTTSTTTAGRTSLTVWANSSPGSDICNEVEFEYTAWIETGTLQNGTVLYSASTGSSKINVATLSYVKADGSNDIYNLNGATATVGTFYGVCAGATTTSTTSTTTTTTTTTAAPTTTTSTTTTTAARFLIEAGFDASSFANACANYPFDLVDWYGLYNNLADVEANNGILYTASTGSTRAAVGYYSDDGVLVYFFDTTGPLVLFGSCAGTTTTTTSTTTTTAAPTTTTTAGRTSLTVWANSSPGTDLCNELEFEYTAWIETGTLQNGTVLYSASTGSSKINVATLSYVKADGSNDIYNLNGATATVGTFYGVCGATTTTTAAPTTTTTISLTPFTQLNADATANAACADHPASITLYGNASQFENCTRFYDDSGGASPTNGFDYWYTNGQDVLRIDTNGYVTDTDSC